MDNQNNHRSQYIKELFQEEPDNQKPSFLPNKKWGKKELSERKLVLPEIKGAKDYNDPLYIYERKKNRYKIEIEEKRTDERNGNELNNFSTFLTPVKDQLKNQINELGYKKLDFQKKNKKKEKQDENPENIKTLEQSQEMKQKFEKDDEQGIKYQEEISEQEVKLEEKKDQEGEQQELKQNQIKEEQIEEQEMKQQERNIYHSEQSLEEDKKLEEEINMMEKSIVQASSQRRQIKYTIYNSTTHIEEKENFTKQQIFSKIDVYYQSDPKLASLLCENILDQTASSDNIQQSKKVIETVEDEGLKTILQGFTSFSENSDIPFLIVKESSIETQLTTKILSTGFCQNKVKFREHLQDSEQWNFSTIYKDQEKRKQFKQLYKKQKAEEFGIDEDSIVIHRFIEGSIDVEFSIVDEISQQKVLQKNSVTKRLKLNPYFLQFQLSPKDFDPRGNIHFSSQPAKNQRRGGYPYYQPVYGKRYGLHVCGKYDKGNDAWLAMNGQIGQWAVAFHGVQNPTAICRSNLSIFSSIMQGLQTGEMLKAGSGQGYSQANAVNHAGEKVGVGVYLSPHFQVCLRSYSNPVTVNGNKFYMVLQCRVNPRRIKVAEGREQYWILNESKDIRPYGVILFKQEDRNKILSLPLFQEQFKYANFEKQIQKHLSNWKE